MSRVVTSDMISSAIKIHRRLGPGLLESAYEACLAYELGRLGRKVERQRAVPLFYEEVKLDCGFRADLVVDGTVVVELKCKETLHPRGRGAITVSPSAAQPAYRIVNQLSRARLEGRD